jgi:hypothetical protein
LAKETIFSIFSIPNIAKIKLKICIELKNMIAVHGELLADFLDKSFGKFPSAARELISLATLPTNKI